MSRAYFCVSGLHPRCVLIEEKGSLLEVKWNNCEGLVELMVSRISYLGGR